MRYALPLIALLASPAFAKTDKPVPLCSGPIKPSLFISPMGEPFRPRGNAEDPLKRWFDQADANHDGKLTVGEMMLDADRFFATIDKDHSGELLPDEVYAYEQDIAPEIRLYQRRREPGDKGRPEDDDRSRPKKRRGSGAPDGVMGAGHFAFLNIPNPVASADDDINRAVSQKEFRAAAAERFRDLDVAQQKALSIAQLPRTPAQIAANAACLQQLRDKREPRR